MRSTERVNARLFRVDGPAGQDDWEAAAGGGAEKWAAGGGVGVLFEETRQRTIAQGKPTITVWRSLQVREELGVDWQAGDVVTFRPDDLASDLVGTVQAVEDPHTHRGQAAEVVLTLELVG